MLNLLALLALALLAQPAPSADAVPAAPAKTPAELAFDDLFAGRYLDAIDRLSHAPRSSPERSLWVQLHPIIGGLVDPAALSPGEAKLDPQVTVRLSRASTADAIAAIVERARRTNVVILNEAHHSPRDRAFALEVARALRPLGYSILAAEAFANPPDDAAAAQITSQIAADGYARRSSGFYIHDPVFADFIRQAVALGYRPVSYEENRPPRPGEDPIATREQAQADNLVKRIFSRDPTAKVLIHVGFAHAAEAPIAPGATSWMAARLKRMTGVDPLTIDQTYFSETGDGTGRAYYDLIRPRLARDPVILVEGAEPFRAGRYADAIDLSVVHPPVRLVSGRPNWLLRIGRRPHPVPPHLLPPAGRRLVQAFKQGEDAAAIPLDQVLVEAGKPAPALMLPPGVPVRFAVQDPS